MQKVVFIFLILSNACFCFAQRDSVLNKTEVAANCGDIITFKSESTVKAKVLEITRTEVIYKRCANLAGPSISIFKFNIKSIKFTNDSIVTFEDQSLRKYKKNKKDLGLDTFGVIPRQRNAIYGTVGLFALIEGAAANISYERHILYIGRYKRAAIALRASYGGFGSIGGSGTTIILASNFIFGRRNSHLEMGLGPMLLVDSYDKARDYFPAINLGYRYQNPEKPFIFRTGFGTEGLYLSFGSAFFKAKKK